MGIENPVHLIFIAAVALIVLGPKRLPALARALGQAVREFRASLEQGAESEPELDAQHAQPSPHAQQPPGDDGVRRVAAAPHGEESSSELAAPEPSARPGAGA